MASFDQTPLTRPNWTGADADVDIHVEEHLGIVDSVFAYSSKLANIMNIRSLSGTNNLRVDRLGNVAVAGRKSGEALNVSKVHNDKFNLVVDTLLYTRHTFDKFDQWTSSFDERAEVAKLDGTALAKQFDQAALIMAAKCADFVVPTGLEGSFHPGILQPVTVSGLAANGEADADALVRAHRLSIEQLINRDLGDQLAAEGVTFVTPHIFTLLLEHKRLMNVEFQGGMGDNNFARGRIAHLNGIRLVETPRIPTAAITSNPLGPAFNVTAAEARRQMITIIPSLTLIAAQVHPLDGKYWEREEDFAWVLDTYQSYNIGQRRPDSAAVVDITETGV
jgi:hypothetical protein